MIEKTLRKIRESKELGVGSCSYIDECFTDDELREQINEYRVTFPKSTVQEIFNFFLRLDKADRERDYVW